ncbi:MAG: tyrosine-type recombinase/integrase [Bacteroidota bacterium]
MNFRNILWTYAPKKDGTCDIKVYFSSDSKKRYVSTGIKILPKFWDEKGQEVKSTHPLAKRYNAKITRLRLDIERHFLDGYSWETLFKKECHASITEFLQQIIKEGEAGTLPLTSGTLNNYRSSLTRLRQYEIFHSKSAPSMQALNMTFYHTFVGFLASEGNCQLPGINKHIKIIKRLMNMGLERGLHQNTIHQQKGFSRPRSKKSNKIFLNEQDIAALETANLSRQPHLQRELDRWLIAYYFMLRFSDLQAIGPEKFQEMNGRSFLQYRSIKTNKQAMVPVRSKAAELLQKYNFDFSWGTNQQANRQVKMAIAAVGLNDMIEQDGDFPLPKSALVTMHTARRSGATNLYLSGQFSLKTIADLGGWKDVKTLQIYLRCNDLDSAKLAAQSEYFK